MKVVFFYSNQHRAIFKEIDSRDLSRGLMAMAPATAGMSLATKITLATQPIKDLLIGLADPVCYVVFAWGLLECMLGKSSSGITRMKYATLGYLGMNYIPDFMAVLRGGR